MDANELFMAAYRFSRGVVPAELLACVPQISYNEKLGWVGEYWYFLQGSPVPRVYIKLHLPEGIVLEIKKLTDEMGFSGPVPERALSPVQAAYLEQCVQAMEATEVSGKECSQLYIRWLETLTPSQRIWFRTQRGNAVPEAKEETAPPEWLVKYWTADRVRSLLANADKLKNEKLRPTEQGLQLWHRAKKMPAARNCIPAELEPGLPRLSWSREWGWVGEYWYYYANAGLGFWLFAEPKYYLKVSLSAEQVLEVKNLTGELQFRQSWLDIWAPWMYENELDYLARCEQLMQEAVPTKEKIAALQGMWLEAHPKEHALWLAGNSQLSEAAVRWILSPGRIPDEALLGLLWLTEMTKGIMLGTPDLAEQCVHNLTEIERYPLM